MTRQYGRYTVTATQPATIEGKIALVGAALPELKELLRRYDKRMEEQEQKEERTA